MPYSVFEAIEIIKNDERMLDELLVNIIDDSCPDDYIFLKAHNREKCSSYYNCCDCWVEAQENWSEMR